MLCCIVWLSITTAFELNCRVDVNRAHTVECDSVDGDTIDEDWVICIYDEEQRAAEKC